ncbi:hypothetical protein PHISCL_02121 [Aspergillus sclerotialis]|uniref:Uncharacterized protein n=1 Tax=Aspergillus sclerotialis TaxID=2070753 RepID=A0A3A2ZQS6_9EURO|nr:hypothetical protein PHISCL_02121 [Aspergillus sclerotialis]
MEHVSTLCAISTVGIAATGFALGRSEQPPKQGPLRRKTLSLLDRPSFPSNTELASGSRSPRPPRTSQAAFPPNAVNSHADDAHSSHVDKGPNPPKEPSAGVLRPRRRCQTYTNPPVQLTEDQPANFQARRPSSSWLRRLSIVSFQTENPFGHASPPLSSPNGPASPGVSSSSGQRRTPNKLVKRPVSQHPNANHLITSDLSSRPSISRRPATSYQRSETLRHRATHSLNFEPSFNTHSLPSEKATTQESESWRLWRPLFHARRDGISERLVRRLSAAGRQRDQALRRILPSTGVAPTLLLGTSISNQKSTTGERNRRNENDQLIQFRDPFEGDHAGSSHPDTAVSPEERSCADVPSTCLEEAEPGISPPSADVTNVEKPRSESLSLVDGGGSSTPLNDQSKPAKPQRTISSPPQTREKPNITELNAFRPPQTALEIGLPTPRVSEAGRPHRRIISYPLSRDIKVNMGCRVDTVKRPSTSDAVTMPTFQYALDRQSDLNNSFHPRHRSRRHSVAASDPASTIIGSDDTHIFTSGEEDETDFLSDTAFDSIRTHITTNSSSASGPRIETIFDRSPSTGLTKDGCTHLEDITSHKTPVSRKPNKDPLIPTIHGSTDLAPANSPHKTADRDAVREKDLFPSEWPGEDTFGLVKNEVSNIDGASDIRLVEGDPHSQRIKVSNTYPKMNIFDWSEQPRNDHEAPGAETRPRTVHGKHVNELRGCRIPGRKAPSFLHLRSQSVPTSREPGSTNESRKSSGKFGTWGLGSKGVSEDWDGDFDFGDGDDKPANETRMVGEENCRREMVVPQAIMERQDSFHGQFGLVQELTLLVEELKRLRQQATHLNIINGPSHELWREAEGIVNLATIDDEDNHSPPRSPSSLTFSFDDSEEESSRTNNTSKRGSGESWPASLSERTDSYSHNPHECRQSSSPKANFVLEMASQRFSQGSTFNNTSYPRSHKLPFDTQSLHDLVIRAGVVTRALKEAIRNAEAAVMTSPAGDLPRSDPPFSRIFEEPPSDDGLPEFQNPCIG